MYGVVQAGDNGWGSAGPWAGRLPAWPSSSSSCCGSTGWRVVGPAAARRPLALPLAQLHLGSHLHFVRRLRPLRRDVHPAAVLSAIMGVDAQGSGLRLLPVVAGMVVGLMLALVVAARLGRSSAWRSVRRRVRGHRNRHDDDHDERRCVLAECRSSRAREPASRSPPGVGGARRTLGRAQRRGLRAPAGRGQARPAFGASSWAASSTRPTRPRWLSPGCRRRRLLP